MPSRSPTVRDAVAPAFDYKYDRREQAYVAMFGVGRYTVFLHMHDRSKYKVKRRSVRRWTWSVGVWSKYMGPLATATLHFSAQGEAPSQRKGRARAEELMMLELKRLMPGIPTDL